MVRTIPTKVEPVTITESVTDEVPEVQGSELSPREERKAANMQHLAERKFPKTDNGVPVMKRRHYVNYLRFAFALQNLECLVTDDWVGVQSDNVPDCFAPFNREDRDNIINLLKFWEQQFFDRSESL